MNFILSRVRFQRAGPLGRAHLVLEICSSALALKGSSHTRRLSQIDHLGFSPLSCTFSTYPSVCQRRRFYDFLASRETFDIKHNTAATWRRCHGALLFCVCSLVTLIRKNAGDNAAS